MDTYLNKFYPNSTHGPRGTLAKYTESIDGVKAVKEKLRTDVRGDKERHELVPHEEVQAILRKLKDPPLSNNLQGLLGNDMYRSAMDALDVLMTVESDISVLHVNGLGHDIIKRILQPLDNIKNKLQKARNILKEWATYSNRTETQTHTQTTNHNSQNNTVDAQDWKDLNAGVLAASPTDAKQASNNPEMNDDMVDSTIPDEEIVNFIGFYLKLIKESELVQPLQRNNSEINDELRKKNYCDKMKATATHIMKWDSDLKIVKQCMPAETVGEKDAIQPILHALLYRLSTIQPSASSESSDDSKNDYNLRSDIHTESRIKTNIRDNAVGGNAGKGSRCLDDEVGSLRPFHGVLPPHLARAGIEAKNIARKNRNADELHEEARNQIIGLCAKKILVAFDFGNVGIDASTTGVIITPVYVQFVRVSIQGMGTKEAEVVLEESPMAPLVDREAFDHLVKRSNNREYLLPLLFPARGESAIESSDQDTRSIGTDEDAAHCLPKGILQLHHMLHSKDPTFLDEIYFKSAKELGLRYLAAKSEVSEVKEAEQKPDDMNVGVGKLIGSGGFGMAFEASWHNDTVVKASHFGELKSIKQEIKALRRLLHGNIDSNCCYVPRLESYGSLECTICNIKTTTPAFVITPRATPLNMQTIDSNDCKNIFKDIKKALDFIHGKNVFHLDVSPRNIMRREIDNQLNGRQYIYILIDFGCAIVSPAKAKGCLGTLAYTHKEIHMKGNADKWEPGEKHDRASLAFTMAAFGSKKLIPWHGFNERVKYDEEVFQERRKVAKKVFRELSFTTDDNELLSRFVRGA